MHRAILAVPRQMLTGNHLIRPAHPMTCCKATTIHGRSRARARCCQPDAELGGADDGHLSKHSRAVRQADLVADDCCGGRVVQLQEGGEQEEEEEEEEEEEQEEAHQGHAAGA
jgi:hypothetical protein